MIWEELKHFKNSENWGDPDKMNPDFLKELDSFRDLIGKECVLTCPAYAEDGHLDHSMHYLGLAVDCRFLDENQNPLSLKEHALIALKAPFLGVGIYTWSHAPFLHFDGRKGGIKTIWVSEKEGDYQPLSIEFLGGL